MVNSWQYYFGRVMLVALALLLPTLVVQAKDVTKKTAWQMDKPASSQQLEADDAHARVIVFRLQHKNDLYQAMPVNIFANKQYHGSLLPEHQAVGLSLCPGQSTLLVVPGNRKDSVSLTHQKLQDKSPELMAGKTYYYQVAIDNEGQIQHRWVDAAEANEVIKTIKIQTYTLSRVKNTLVCPLINATKDIWVLPDVIGGLITLRINDIQNSNFKNSFHEFYNARFNKQLVLAVNAGRHKR